MRAVRVVIAVAILLLTACSARPTQTVTPAPAPPVPHASGGRASDTPTAAEAPAVTLAPTSPPATTAPTATPTAPVEPAFRRALYFGIAAGNSYNPWALAVHPGLGRLMDDLICCNDADGYIPIGEGGRVMLAPAHGWPSLGQADVDDWRRR